MDASQCRVYSRFTGKRKDGSTVKLRVQDMPAECMEVVLDLFINVFMKDEMVYKAAGVYYNEESRAEAGQLFQQIMQAVEPKITICCVDDDRDAVGTVAAVSIVYVSDGVFDLSKFETKTKELKKLFEIFTYLDCYDVLKEQNVKNYYEDLGIVIHPEYRGLGIATEIVKERRTMCMLEDVPISAAWATAERTQKIAESQGWKTVLELAYEDLGKRFDVVFDKTPPTAKFMVLRA